MNPLRTSLLLLPALLAFSADAGQKWQLNASGGISREIQQGETFSDHIEMSGRKVSMVLTYGVKDGRFTNSKTIAFPHLRTIPNNTHGHATVTFDNADALNITLNGHSIQDIPAQSIAINERLIVQKIIPGVVDIRQEIFPSPTLPAIIETITIRNLAKDSPLTLVATGETKIVPCSRKGIEENYSFRMAHENTGTFSVKDSITFSTVYSARKGNEAWPKVYPEAESTARQLFLQDVSQAVHFTCPDKAINELFFRSKFHAFESLFDTKNGLIHSPGGMRYYAAIWANDECEYVNPFFACSGYPDAVESAMTSWRWYAAYMNPDYKPLPSSIIAEGTDIWNGAGDRGDAAMVAYGAARFALSLGDRKVAKELWPLISWCLEYNRRQLTSDGVVASDCDELERRFPAGKANLCTSSLYYDALISAVALGRDLSIPAEETTRYTRESAALREAIERYFGSTVQGFETYRYYDGNDLLRAWICIPLTMGIFDRAPATLDALYSDKLWMRDGLRTQAGNDTYWDRSTLYALRGAFAAGDTDRSLQYLKRYSSERLLGGHVPYPVEAPPPEAHYRQLSGESALYCRVIIEGIFGYRPTGLRAFELRPRLPAEWDFMTLSELTVADGNKISISLKRTPEGIHTEACINGTLMPLTPDPDGVIRVSL